MYSVNRHLFTSVAAVLLLSQSLSAQVTSLDMVSKGSPGNPGNGSSSAPLISDTGSVVVFQSDADNLTADDSNGQSDIFVYLTGAGELSRLSVSSAGAQTQERSSTPLAISGDGNIAVFLSTPSAFSPQPVPASCEAQSIFVRNRTSQTTEELVLTQDGKPLDGWTYPADMNADGRYLVFVSSASNLALTGLEEGTFLVLRDMQTGEMQVIQRLYQSALWGEARFTASISADGRYTAYDSCLPPDANEEHMQCDCEAAVYLYDRQTGQSKLISINAAGEGADADASSPSISSDGAFIAFSSAATNLVPPEAGEAHAAEWQPGEIYLYDRVHSTLSVASVNEAGEESDGNCTKPSLSATGRYLVFTSEASNLGPSSDVSLECENTALYRRDLRLGTVLRIDQKPDSGLLVSQPESAALAANGLAAVFAGKSQSQQPSALMEEEEDYPQIFYVQLEGEPDSLVIEQPSLSTLMKSLNKAVSRVRPVVTVKGPRASVSVQGFARLVVRKKRGRGTRYTCHYEINVAGARDTRSLGRSRHTFTLPGGKYKVSYRVRVSNGSKVMWSRKSYTSAFRVR